MRSGSKERASSLSMELSEPAGVIRSASGGRGYRGYGSAGGGIGVADYAKSQAQGARGQAMRGLFRYDVPGRVTVPDRSSTLVSLVNRKIEGEDLLLYRPDAGGAARNHPYRTVRFKNDTGYMLQGGPVTVLSNGMFVGSGVFNRIEADAETFLPFSLERGISIKTEQKYNQQGVKLLAITDGRIRCETRQSRTQKYEITRLNKDAPSKLYLRIARRSGWSLKNPPDDTREHVDAWYVPTKVGGETTTLEITDEQTYPRSYSWNEPMAKQALKLYLEGDADPAVKAAVKKVQAANEELVELARQRTQLMTKRQQIESEQSRLRQNIETLGEAKVNRGLTKKFATRLGKNEAAIAKLNAQVVTLNEVMHAKRQALKALISEVKL